MNDRGHAATYRALDWLVVVFASPEVSASDPTRSSTNRCSTNRYSSRSGLSEPVFALPFEYGTAVDEGETHGFLHDSR
jgi:hypothetical protein